ncbi:hypothetical protein ACSFE6_13115 [Pseudomonas baetica]|uniref:hypothetical protein n=1 Tax=Pseudomonas baetica TaxID=674054 RepID=UPI003EEDEAC3
MGSNPAWCAIFYPLYYKGLASLPEACPSPESRFCHKFATLERGGNGRNGNNQESRRVSVGSANPPQGLSSPKKTFETKADAQAWACMIEIEIDRGIILSR